MRSVLKIHKKGIIILPKRVREALRVKEGDELVVELREGKIILRPLKPEIVDVDPEVVEKFLQEEYELEKRKYTGMTSSEKASNRH